MSRAERLVVPPRPRLARVLRLAAIDLYDHGVRLVVANVVWGVTLLLSGFVLVRSPLGLVLVAFLIPASAGLMGMATRLVRQRTLVLSDFWDGISHRFAAHLGLSLAQLILIVVAGFDLLLGLQTAGFPGVILTVAAFYTFLAIWLIAWVAWPLLLDPLRSDEPIRSSLRLAVLLLVAQPARIGGLGLLLAAFLVISTILVAAIVTVSGAYAFLVAAHYVLPAADRLEGRSTLEVRD
ncbi:MAG: hypothetical protein ACRDGJ_02555 [Candidatus Limnocylindria bacterium]